MALESASVLLKFIENYPHKTQVFEEMAVMTASLVGLSKDLNKLVFYLNDYVEGKKVDKKDIENILKNIVSYMKNILKSDREIYRKYFKEYADRVVKELEKYRDNHWDILDYFPYGRDVRPIKLVLVTVPRLLYPIGGKITYEYVLSGLKESNTILEILDKHYVFQSCNKDYTECIATYVINPIFDEETMEQIATASLKLLFDIVIFSVDRNKAPTLMKAFVIMKEEYIMAFEKEIEEFLDSIPDDLKSFIIMFGVYNSILATMLSDLLTYILFGLIMISDLEVDREVLSLATISINKFQELLFNTIVALKAFEESKREYM